MKLLSRTLLLQLLVVFLVLATVTWAEDGDEEACADFDEEDACNDGRIGDGFTSTSCRWCRNWFGTEEASCNCYANPICW